MNTILKIASLAMIVLGMIQTLSGNSPLGFVLITSGCIVDLQVTAREQEERIKNLEQKDKKDATQST